MHHIILFVKIQEKRLQEKHHIYTRYDNDTSIVQVLTSDSSSTSGTWMSGSLFTCDSLTSLSVSKAAHCSKATPDSRAEQSSKATLGSSTTTTSASIPTPRSTLCSGPPSNVCGKGSRTCSSSSSRSDSGSGVPKYVVGEPGGGWVI